MRRAQTGRGGAVVNHRRSTRNLPLLRAARYGLPALIAALVFVCFLLVLDNDFIVSWDDGAYFLSNPHYRGLSFTHLRWMFTTLYMSHYQPLSWLTHGVVYTLWGLNPKGYHLVNLLLHCANAVLAERHRIRVLLRVDDQGCDCASEEEIWDLLE